MELFASSSGNSEAQFYEQLFRTFDTQNVGTIQGGQVFGFFMSSGLNKLALGDVWDEATQRQSGGLTVQKFMNAMKLITLCQRGIAPKLANIAQHAPVPPPQMQYPSHLKLPATAPAAATASASQSQPAVQPQASAADDPFGGLTQGLGFEIGSTNSSNPNLGGAAKPNAPIWTGDAMPDNANMMMTPTTTGTDNINMDLHQSPPLSYNHTAMNGAAAAGLGLMTDMNLNSNANVNSIAMPATVTANGSGNEYAPPPHPKQLSVTVEAAAAMMPPSHTLTTHSDSVRPPALDRRISTKILYQEERLREQIRQAEGREKLANQKANTQRIENERLERENEALKLEINTARQAQADALKQSQDALSSIKPLQTENEKLKQAISAWKELIQTKDEELEALEAEVDQLRLENEKLENVLRDDKSKVDDIQFKLQRSDALLQDLKRKNREYEAQVDELREENVRLEDEKRSLELKVVQVKDEMKKLKRNQNSGLGINDKSTLKQKEQSLFNINDISFGGSNGNESSAPPPAQSKKNKEKETEQDAEVDLMPSGKVDFDFSEPGGNGQDEHQHAPRDDDNEFGPANMGIGFIDDNGFDHNNNDKRGGAAAVAATTGSKNNDDDNDDSDDDEEEEEDDGEPDMIEKEIEEKVEIEEDVVKSVLIDEEYQSSEWYMSNLELKSYRKFFLQADANNDGVVDGGEANKFFTKSKLNRKLLAKIWVLADQDKKGKLNEAMFCVMFHIVMKVKKAGGKLVVPAQLPECLSVDVVEKLGTKIEKTVKQKKWVTQKKTIKVPNPNKTGKAKTTKSKKKSKSKSKSKTAKKAAPPPLPADSDHAATKMDDFAADWGNDFAFDATESSTATHTGSPQKYEEQTQPAAVTDDAAADDNWNAFGEFFDGQT